MACENCKKVKLNSCEECDFTINTDCVNYTGDRLCVEDGLVKNGSSRTLTSVIEDLDDLCECSERSAKVITGDHQIILEDACKILLLDGELSDLAENVTYTITLPDTSNGDATNFINKTLIFKDISQQNDPSGSVLWEFDQSIKYDWENNLSTQSYETLSFSLHKVLWLTFVKHPDNTYKWTPISPNAIDYTTELDDLQDQVEELQTDVSGLITSDELRMTKYETSDLEGSATVYGGSQYGELIVYRKGDHVQIKGAISNFEDGVGTGLMYLPDDCIPDGNSIRWFETSYSPSGGITDREHCVLYLAEKEYPVPSLRGLIYVYPSGTIVDPSDAFVNLSCINFYIPNINWSA